MARREKLFLLISAVIILLATIGFGVTLIIDHTLAGRYDLINDLQEKIISANMDRRASNDRIIYARIYRNTLDSLMDERDDIKLKQDRWKELISDLRIAAALILTASNTLDEISDDELQTLNEKIVKSDSPAELYDFKWKYSLIAAEGERKIESKLKAIKISIQKYRAAKLWILVLSIFLNSVGLLFGILSIRYRASSKDSP